jgi:hypothetical protein
MQSIRARLPPPPPPPPPPPLADANINATSSGDDTSSTYPKILAA